MNLEKLDSKIFLLAVMLWFSDRAVTAEELPRRGVDLAHACATCHGPDGQSAGAIPSINAMPTDTFVASLRAFQSGERQGTVMGRVAKGLDEADMKALAEYFTELRKKSTREQ